jgi:hypothetical protein
MAIGDRAAVAAATAMQLLWSTRTTKSVVEWLMADFRVNGWIHYEALASSEANLR